MIRARTVIIGSLLCISELSLAIEPLITEDDVFGELHLVSSVTHMQQTVEKTPAAVTIIDRRTIEASAAVDVPDLFRLIPGFRTYFVNGNQPAVFKDTDLVCYCFHPAFSGKDDNVWIGALVLENMISQQPKAFQDDRLFHLILKSASIVQLS